MTELTQRPNVEAFIGNHVECLEEVLDERAQQYSRAQREKDGYDFGENLTPDRLSKLAGEVIRDTKDFLGITKAPDVYLSMFYLPRDLRRGVKISLIVSAIGSLAQMSDGFDYNDLQVGGLTGLIFGAGAVLSMQRDHFNSCFDGSKTMRIGEKKEANAAGIIAHEYTHHLQNAFTDLGISGRTRENPIVEGHARGVQGAVSNIFVERYDNPAYAFDHIERTAMELKDAYLFTCNERGISPRESLANLPIPKLRGFLYKHHGHHYSIGVAAMSIAESQQGDKVYRDVMRSNFSFLEN